MHYVRFLKAPSLTIDHGKPQLKLLFTVQTDLGDDFYPCALKLLLSFYKKIPGKDFQKLLTQIVTWKSTDRQVSISLSIPGWRASPSDVVRLSLAPEHTTNYRELSPSDARSDSRIALSPVIGADSLPWRVSDVEAPKDLVRLIRPQYRPHLTIREEAGHSIERHVWDAGMAAVACIDLASTLVLGVADAAASDSPFLPSLARLAVQNASPHVLELGAGAGLVGCEISRAFPGSHVTLTDLPDARSIAEGNASQVVSHNTASMIRRPDFKCLDWTKDLPGDLKRATFDLIVAADCTYNPDYSPALVKTIEALTESSPWAVVMVATKTRHKSEAIFFEKMKVAKFNIIEHEIVLAPMDHSEEALQDCDKIDIYIFARLSDTRIP